MMNAQGKEMVKQEKLPNNDDVRIIELFQGFN